MPRGDRILGGSGGGGLTAQQIVERIQQQLGTGWKNSKADTFQAGRPDTEVTGIATTFAPSLDVLRRAVAARKNMIVGRESPFWDRGAAREAMANDPTYRAKREFIRDNNLVVWRFFDNWNARTPDGQLAGLARALGWEKNLSGNGYFRLAPATLKDTAAQIKRTLKMKSIRIIGDPNTRVTKAALSHGMYQVAQLEKQIAEPGVDLVVIGEPIEWEASPYFADLVASGQKKGLIVLGQEVSEEPGCGEMANWLRTFLKDVAVEWIPTGEPAWMPY